MEDHYVMVNFKHYPQSSGRMTLPLLRSLSRMRERVNNLFFALSPLDICSAGMEFADMIMAQHVDAVPKGPYTGRISMEALMDMGVSISLLNHSEFRLEENVVRDTVRRARDIGFRIVLCVDSEERARKYATLGPDFLAYEPPELIGGNISVSKARPEIVRNVVGIGGREGVRVIVGAGIKGREDYQRSLELGADGILVSSGVVLSDDPYSSLNSLINIQSGVSNGK